MQSCILISISFEVNILVTQKQTSQERKSEKLWPEYNQMKANQNQYSLKEPEYSTPRFNQLTLYAAFYIQLLYILKVEEGKIKQM